MRPDRAEHDLRLLGLGAAGLPVACSLARPGLRSCTVELRRGTRLLASATATQPNPGARPLAVSLPVDARLRRLASAPDGVVLTLTAKATQVGRTTPLTVSRPLILTRTPALPVRTDGRFRGTTLRPDATLRTVKLALQGATAIRCTGHTDSRGPAARNQRRALARAQALCAYLTAGTAIRPTVKSKGETKPRATNRTAKGRAANRRVDALPTYA